MDAVIINLCVSTALIIGASTFTPAPLGNYVAEQDKAMTSLHDLRYQDAILHFERAAELATLQNAPTVERVGLFGTLADIYSEFKNPKQAELNYKRALSAAESDPSCVEYTGVAASALTTFLIQENRYTEAETYAKETVEKFQQALGADNAEVACARSTLGFVYFKQGKQNEAISQYKMALPVLVKACGQDSIEAAVTRVALGDSYSALKQKASARAAYRSALSGLKKDPYTRSPMTREVASKLQLLR